MFNLKDWNSMNEQSIIIVIFNLGNREAKNCLTNINYKDTVVLPPKRVIFVNQFELIPNFEDETSPFLGAGLNAFFKSL